MLLLLISVRLVVLGDPLPKDQIEAVAAGLEAALPVQVDRTPLVLPLPKSAWYAPRRRYRADTLLKFLEPHAPPGGKALGITQVDISTDKGGKDWGIFGLATIGGPSAVISSFRLKKGRPSPAKLRHRITSTAVHEIGHTFGLYHCPEPGCVMADAEGSIRNTDEGDGKLGPKCAEILKISAP